MTAAPLFVSQQHSQHDLEKHLADAVGRARRSGKPLVVSVSSVSKRLDPVGVFEAARARRQEAVFWHVPWQKVTLVGVGSVWSVTADGAARFEEVSRRWRAVLDGAVHVADDGLEVHAAAGELQFQDAEVTGRDVAADDDFEKGFRPDMGPGPGPILLGGFAFDAGSATGPWAAFGDARLTLARVTYGATGSVAWTTVNTVVDAETDPRAAAEDVLHDRELAVAPVPSVSDGRNAGHGRTTGAAELDSGMQSTPRLEDVQPKERWLAAVEDVSAAIRSGLLDKAVLARSVRLTAADGFGLGAALRYLQVHYPECYVFAVSRDDECFIGATPERIVHKKDGHVRVACMAGSIARGATPEEDERLGRELLNDAKNMEEHRIVLRSILEALAPVCADVVAAERTGLRKLANVQHLYTPVTARVGGDTDVLALVARVHPTPAIGGWPTDKALALIREKEGMERGWYAGPVGWMDGRGDGEFAVALRSALVQGESALLFAGCGIMGDSVPESEYEESVLKLRPMRAALGAGR